MSDVVIVCQAFFSYAGGMFLCILVHELGHVSFGKIKKWEFHYLISGPILIYRDNRKYRLKLTSDVSTWGGVSAILPRTISETFIKDFAFVLIGGPLSSLVFGSIVLVFGLLLNNIIWIIIGAMSLGIGGVCLVPVPIRMGFVYTDGYRVRRIFKSEQTKKEEEAVYLISIAILSPQSVPYEKVVEFSNLNYEDLILSTHVHYLLYILAKINNNSGNMDIEKKRVLQSMQTIPKYLRKQIKF